MAEPEVEFIPVIENVLDNQMALVMIGCGIIAGVFFLYLWNTYQKNLPTKTLGVSGMEIPTIEGLPSIPSLRGQTDTQPIQYTG